MNNSLRSCGFSETLLFYVLFYVNCAIANLIDISGLSKSCSKIMTCSHHNFIIIGRPVVHWSIHWK